MTIHTASETLVVAELSADEKLGREELGDAVLALLETCGFERWGSLELEVFQGACSQLVFASPVKVLLPECLLRLSKLCDGT